MSQPKFSSKGLIINIDLNSVVWPFLDQALQEETISEATLYPFVDQYKAIEGSQVKAISFCVFCQYSTTDSKVWTDYYEKWKSKTENGVEVNYDKQFGSIVRFNKEYGLDPWKIWFQRTRELGMEAWLSVRMNDCHCPYDPASFLRSDFFYEAREKGWMIGEQYGYKQYCFDYAVPQVRQKMLDYIEEQLDRYDVDALEMDFMREIHCFDYLNCPDRAGIMNDFVGKVRQRVDAAAKKWGHPIKLTAILMRDPDQNLVFGFDTATWVKEGWIDHITPAPRWACCDSDMPIAEWRSRYPGIELSAGVMDLLFVRGFISSDVTNALAANYISQGVDYMYLYNHFLNPYDPPTFYTNNIKDNMNRTGLPETVFSSRRRHIVLYQDTCPIGCDPYEPLPFSVTDVGKSISVSTGYIPEGKQGTLVVGFSEGCPHCTQISVNGLPCRDFRPHAGIPCQSTDQTILQSYAAEGITLLECSIPLDPISGRQLVTFAKGNATIAYLEIIIDD